MAGDEPKDFASQPLRPANPFSTSAVRPGVVEYQFPPHDSLGKLLARLREQNWWGEVIGPHGSGKSTLIQTLHHALRAAGREVQLFTLTRGERSLPAGGRQSQNWHERTQLVIDGFEQLGWWQRWSLQRTCRRRGCGLLVTAHASFGFPPLLTATTSVDLTQQLVSRLLRDDDGVISRAEIQDAFARHAGNLREVFFDLYDQFERRLHG